MKTLGPDQFAVLLLAWVVSSALGQAASDAGPDPHEIPVPTIKTRMGTLPSVKNLPVRLGLPDALTTDDGTKVTSVAQWKKRREEIRWILEYYAVGQMPPPGNVRGQETQSELVLNDKVKYRLVKLTLPPQNVSLSNLY